ncbi:branched-chain amino acid ABC transporter permease [Paradesulfitobacterium ferrireducens]|uniref:branched-chain amino acid ABC transporter permease n=1 Tax=Paradesulfitobacterium ferrireducens TaxID=2816476 RepID=UPI001A8C66A7|nr:branched-chain amino acid ABC transporter permease [Paradesulfitobacterium ferrireducens]
MLLLQFILIGISIGSVYALIALGTVLIYKATRVINFAQGELVMIGAFIGYTSLVSWGLPIFIALPVTLLLSGVIGYLAERFVLRRIAHGPLISVIMVTLGLSIFLKGGVTGVWGTSMYSFPKIFPESTINLLGIKLPQVYFWSMVVAVIIFVLFVFFFKYTDLGLAMRGVADNQKAAASLGVNVFSVVGLSWVFSGIVAALGGILLANISLLNINMSDVGLKAFPVVILGGFDSLLGAVIGGLVIGVIESVAGGYLATIVSGAIDQVVAFAILLIILLIKPQGLFGTKEVERL